MAFYFFQDSRKSYILIKEVKKVSGNIITIMEIVPPALFYSIGWKQVLGSAYTPRHRADANNRTIEGYNNTCLTEALCSWYPLFISDFAVT